MYKLNQRASRISALRTTSGGSITLGHIASRYFPHRHLPHGQDSDGHSDCGGATKKKAQRMRWA